MSSGHQVIIDFKHRLVRKAETAYQRRNLKELMAVIDGIAQFERPSLGLQDRRELDRLTVVMVTMAAEAHLDDLDFETCFRLCSQAISVLEHSAREFSEAGLPPRPSSMLWIGIITLLADAKWKHLQNAHDKCMPFREMVRRYEQATLRVCDHTRSASIAEADAQNRYHALLWCGTALLKQARRLQPKVQTKIRTLMQFVSPAALDNEQWPYYWDLRIADELFSRQSSRQSIQHLFKRREECVKGLYVQLTELTAYRRGVAKEVEYLLSHPLFARSMADGIT